MSGISNDQRTMAILEFLPRQALYHYASMGAFESILRSRSLWFSDLSAMNDPRELALGHERALEALKSVRHREYEGYQGLFLSIIAARLESMKKDLLAFSCSFSLAGDSLPLWGEYTKYEGVSIGFKPTAFNDVQGRIQKVRYLRADDVDSIRDIVVDISRDIDPDGMPKDSQFWIDASVSIFASITALKHGAWAHEQEVRMVRVQSAAPPDLSDRGRVDEEVDQWVQPMTRDGMLGGVAYLAFPFGRYRYGADRHRRAIQSVIVGPKCTASLDDIGALLAKHGYDAVRVVRSNCLIR